MRRAAMSQVAESTSGSRCTRSHLQAAAVWPVQDMFILVNEIVAVEGDCQNALSTHQKWTIIAETCTALGVVKNAYQCRRKWQSLLADYNQVKAWNSKSRNDSYWSLGCERREEASLPSDFDKDLYEAIDNFMKASDRADTDPECDPDAVEGDELNDEESGPKPKSKRRRRRSISQKRPSEDWRQPALEVEFVRPERPTKERRQHALEVEFVRPERPSEERRQPAFELGFVRPEQPSEERRQPAFELGFVRPEQPSEERRQPAFELGFVRPKPPVVEDMEQILAAKLMENTELVHAILAGNYNESIDEDLSNTRDEEELKIARVRYKADKLVACLGDLTKNLEHLCGVVEKG